MSHAVSRRKSCTLAACTICREEAIIGLSVKPASARWCLRIMGWKFGLVMQLDGRRSGLWYCPEHAWMCPTGKRSTAQPGEEKP